MSAVRRTGSTRYPTFVKVMLPEDVHRDLNEIAAASLIATGTLVRSLITAHIRKVNTTEAQREQSKFRIDA